MKHQRKAFTMIEIIFVIVILGILSSVAISKMAITRDDAQIVKGKANVVAIRNAIMLTRSTNMLQAMGAAWPALLDDATTGDGKELFDGNATMTLFDYPLISRTQNGYWRKTVANSSAGATYAYRVMNTDVNFTYTVNNGLFNCSTTTGSATANELCRNLTQ